MLNSTRDSMIDPRVPTHLASRGVSHAVIGALALAAHGAPRYSADADLMVLDPVVLRPDFWAGAGLQPSELRTGDEGDPLAGLATFPGPPPLDLIVGKGYAARQALDGAIRVAGLPCPVVDPLGLALLKLEAGGPKDIQDLVLLMDAQIALNGWDLMAAVEPHLASLTPHAKRSWEKLKRLLA